MGMLDEAPIDEEELETRLSSPDQVTTDTLGAIDGDILVLGAGGKMGPSLARMARRASQPGRRIIAVSRFGNAHAKAALDAQGIETIRADLSEPASFATLPDAANVIWMAGQKFGTSGDPVATWTHNTVAAVHAAERFTASRIVVFSTGNVYPRTPVASGGSRESDALAPANEYAASCIARERVFEAVARRTGASLLFYRLFYANDLRYGVVTDIALKVLRGEPVPLAMGAVNVIWQADANRLALRALQHTRPVTPALANGALALNVTGPIIATRAIAGCIARTAGIEATFDGEPAPDALLANTEALQALLPFHAVSLEQLCAWTVAWIKGNGRLLDKPTKFESRSGAY